jgi:hypothetical protein
LQKGNTDTGNLMISMIDNWFNRAILGTGLPWRAKFVRMLALLNAAADNPIWR